MQSFQDLLKDMATLTRNRIRFDSSASEFHHLTESTTLQRRALELLLLVSSQVPYFLFTDSRRLFIDKHWVLLPNFI